MRYTVRKSVVQVIGHIWMPNTVAAMALELSAYDVSNIGEVIDRDTVQDWLDSHAGDFQSVDDFCASIESGEETIDIDWSDPDSELTYIDCTFGEEDY